MKKIANHPRPVPSFISKRAMGFVVLIFPNRLNSDENLSLQKYSHSHFPNESGHKILLPKKVFFRQQKNHFTVDSRFSYITRWRSGQLDIFVMDRNRLRFTSICGFSRYCPYFMDTSEFRTPISHTFQLLMVTECLYGLMISLEIIAGQRHS